MQNYIGSIIHGTHRPSDLIPAFTQALEELDLDGDYESLLDELNALGPDDDEYWDKFSETAGHYLDALFEALDALAPEGTYFGAHEGDGSDFGFWPAHYYGDDHYCGEEVDA